MTTRHDQSPDQNQVEPMEDAQRSGGENAEVAVWRAAIELFEGDRAAAERWLYREAKGLGRKRPIEVMQADPQQVLDLIGRLEHGVGI